LIVYSLRDVSCFIVLLHFNPIQPLKRFKHLNPQTFFHLTSLQSLKLFLDKKVDEYNQPFFIDLDPICIPHSFSKQQDIEISGFFAAMFAWGNRKAIIAKSRSLMELMDNAPHEFCLHHTKKDLKRLEVFKHRTFNTTDLLYFITFFKYHYTNHDSLESAFTNQWSIDSKDVKQAITAFHDYCFSLRGAPARTKKHISTPDRKSACKRINMFLRWMVRQDKNGVDFGIWKQIQPHQLVMPLDLHVCRVAKKLNLLNRNITDWPAAIELTDNLKYFDANDPVKYDFALFGMGVMEGIKVDI
jgi:uncharacterized protein (TIGR02757 family)